MHKTNKENHHGQTEWSKLKKQFLILTIGNGGIPDGDT